MLEKYLSYDKEDTIIISIYLSYTFKWFYNPKQPGLMGVGQKHEWKIRSSIRNNIKIYHPIVDIIENENNVHIHSVIFKIDNYTEKSKN